MATRMVRRENMEKLLWFDYDNKLFLYPIFDCQFHGVGVKRVHLMIIQI